MLSEVYNINTDIKKIHQSKKANNQYSNIKATAKEYAISKGYSDWDSLLMEMKKIDIENNICPRCHNIPPFNPLTVCSKCRNRYDSNGDIVKEKV